MKANPPVKTETIKFSPGDILLAVIHGNEASGPECIEASDRDVTFFIATAVR